MKQMSASSTCVFGIIVPEAAAATETMHFSAGYWLCSRSPSAEAAAAAAAVDHKLNESSSL